MKSLTVCAFFLMAGWGVAYPDGPASVESRRERVSAYLNALPKLREKKMLSGQQCQSWPKIRKTGLADLRKVHDKTGKWPALAGFDYFEPKGSKTEPELFKPARWREINPFIREWAAKGGMVTLSAHLPNPWTGGSAWDTSGRGAFGELLREETASCKVYRRMVTEIADGLEDLQRSGIVVLWRPFHESEGTWFWWGGEGKDGSRARIVKELWRGMHGYMTKTRGLKNLVWVFNGYSCHYPGDDTVDLNSADIYAWDVGKRITSIVPKLAANDRKPFALAEFGPPWKSGQKEKYDFSRFADEVLAAAPNCVYFVAWTGPWSLWHNENTGKLMSDPRIVTLDDLPLR